MNRLSFIASRYLTSQNNLKFISNINYLSILGLSIGIAVLIITMGVLNGFENEVKKKIVSFDGHIRVNGYFNNPIFQNSSQLDSIIDNNSEIVNKIEFINHAATIRFKNQTEPVFIEAFGQIKNNNFFELNKNIVFGNFNLNSTNPSKGIVIGKVLYDRLNINLGQKITLMDLKSLGNPGVAPRILQFELRGVYETGLTEYDESIVYINLNDAQTLLKYNNLISGYILSLDQIDNTSKIGNLLNDKLNYPLTSSTWIERHSNLFEWLSLQKYPITIVFAMIALVGILNISSSLTMIVMEKTKSIGVMRAIGFSENDLLKLFFLKGAIIGFSGVFFGLTISLFFAFFQTKFNILSIPQEVYFMGSLPIKIIPINVLIVGSMGIILAIIASIYPARIASKIEPSNAIRYE
tara:strand:+ start:118742 stop:119965 length:1224 start_codon:yes stop_codon:yes gene_type:complete